MSDDEIHQMIAQPSKNPVLDQAFSFIKAADYVAAHDLDFLLQQIHLRLPVTISPNRVINFIKHDLDLARRAQQILMKNPKMYAVAFKDQLRELVDFKSLDHAMTMIKDYPELLKGSVPVNLRSIKGGQSLILRTALFYICITKFQAGSEDPSEIFKELMSFYPGALPEDNKINNLLHQTHLINRTKFMSPAHSYVKNADVSIPVKLKSNNLCLEKNLVTCSKNLTMIFTDCSGYVVHILRQLNPKHSWLQNNRFMSYHLAATYDMMINAQHGTKEELYDIYGRCSRPLTPHEQKHLHNSNLLPLAQLFDPVVNPIQHTKSGDIIVMRHPQGAVEGHVVIVVARHPRNLDDVLVVELTRADVDGRRHGYHFRKISLSNPGKDRFCRVLRMKQNRASKSIVSLFIDSFSPYNRP